MIPSILARQLHQGVCDYIEATFPVASPYFKDMIKNFLEKPGNIFKGPYYQLGLPFVASHEKGLPFTSIVDPEFRPYEHQRKAWARLSGDSPLSTIVATGTGSGKTECFLYPVLDWCSRHQERGIKAILLYPMNALADDQSRRIAKLISSHPSLSNIRAAVYTGDSTVTGIKVMTNTELITDRNTIREYPPDILLTNYKMLDFLLLRAPDRRLWDEKALRFLIVDELHSFDGAQGTDLACLIRRLRERVGRSERNSLACIGTSATLSDNSDTTDLLDFAKKIFLSDFDEDSVITETRQNESEFFSESFVTRIGLPSADQLFLLEPFSHGIKGDAAQARELYLKNQMHLWFPDIAWTDTEEDLLTLGIELKNHGVFQNLVRFMGGKSRVIEDLIQHFRKTYTSARSLSDYEISLIIDSIFSLVSHARAKDGSRIVPFLTVRTQLWFRELRRLVSDIAIPSGNPDSLDVTLRLSDEIPATDTRVHFPVMHCRECNTVGWLTRESPGDEPVIRDLRTVYNGYFGQARDTIILFPKEKNVSAPSGSTEWRLCPECGYISYPSVVTCPRCHHNPLLPVYKSYFLNKAGNFESACPRCGGAGDLAIIGAQAASLLASLVGQTFSSPFNTDKKLLAFSDSVQDAAHRAGFLTSRAWTFGFRTAIARTLENGPEHLPLTEFTESFLEYWKDTCKTPEDFVGTFIPPDLTWMYEYDDLKKTGILKYDSKLPDLVHRRLSWEIASEFTFRSTLGRTLEKSRVALMYPAPSALEEAAEILGREISERQERFRDVAPDHPEWKRFLRGILLRMKNIGAVNEDSIKTLYPSGNTFVFHRKSIHMPQFYPRFPRVPAENPCKKTHEPVFAEQHKSTWISNWWNTIKLRLLEGLELDRLDLDAEVFRIAFNALCQTKLTEELILPGNTAGWMLNLNNMIVSREVSAFCCSACTARIQGSADEISLIEGMACLRAGCSGSYKVDRTQVSDYYRDFYRRGEVVRINGYEHTGLLEAKERKPLEESFIAGTHPWDPNFLSATPTLEMGINIGDLSTVFLCSVPPTVANYLQRIGRAGRTDGNAHILSLANAEPHDQYFYQSPEEMISGSIETPAIYDHAVSVLERQLTAYAMGQWIQLAPREKDPMPAKLGDLLVAFTNENAGVFPIAFFESITEHREEWLSGFFNVFDQIERDGDEEQLLQKCLSPDGVYGSGIEHKITERIILIKEAIDNFRLRRDRLRNRISEIKGFGELTNEQKEELEQLVHERGSIIQSIKDIRNRQTWEFLCDEGILPNYAFPESGVKLNATFWRSIKKASGTKEYEYRTLELVRSPSSALRDFAPQNVFYGNGHRMTIDRVDLKASRLETWRFCPSCSHAAPENHEDYRLTACPLCGNAHWADRGQSQKLLRFRQVFSFTSYRESLISDSAEDREPVFYNTKLLIDFDPKDTRNVYFGLEDASTSVGIEFIQRAVFREINFGPIDTSATGFAVAGDRQAKPGFPVCLLCGAIEKKNHAPECPNARKTDTDDHVSNALHLYHEFASEAIRVLVPINEFSLDGETAVQSFIASIYLGLKRHFGGKADHLRIMSEQSETSGGSVLQYIVIYDTIPGGSGYLKDFFRDAHAERATTFFLILEKALESLESCSCKNDPEKDGCYHCVLSHRMSYHMRDLSRKIAIDVIQFILSKRESLVRVHSTAVSRINPAYDSKLEELFVASIKSPHLWPVPTRTEPEIFHDKPGYFVTIGTRSYHLETHVYLRVRSPIPVNTEADFVFWPTALGEKPIVVYTDGFTYHKDIVADDLKIRQALLSNGGYRVFSFTWDDVATIMDKDKKNTSLDLPGHPWINRTLSKDQEMVINQLKLNRSDWPRTSALTGLSAFVSMLSLSETERDALWLDKARYSFFGNLLSQEPESENLEALGSRVGLSFSSKGRYSVIKLPCNKSLTETHEHKLTLVIEHLPERIVPEMSGWLVFDDTSPVDELEWKSLLDLLNLYQIFPKFAVTALPFSEEPDWMTQYFPIQIDINDNWSIVYQEALAEWKPFIDHLASLHTPIPVIGYEFEDSEGSICECAELAWPDRKIAIFRDEAALSNPDIPSEWKRYVWSPDRPFPELEIGEHV